MARAWPGEIGRSPVSVGCCGRIGDGMAMKFERFTLGNLLGSDMTVGQPENAKKTEAHGPAEVG
ncbi:MAG: hypothetical protein ACI9OJ_003573 [Myxococcota bacterium]|jgi:hypothetical protein